MALDFNKYAEEGTLYLKLLAQELGYPQDVQRAGRVLRSVLHALRNRITIEESIQLLSQLPMFLKAIYVENWVMHKQPPKGKKLRDFYSEIRSLDRLAAGIDFQTDASVGSAIDAVFHTLGKYISPGELEDIKAVLPRDLKMMIKDYTIKP